MEKAEGNHSTNVVIVVPTIRHQNLREFIDAWQHEFRGRKIIVIEDNPERTFDIPAENFEHYSWTEIDRDLGKDSWIIPRRTDCIRSYGYWKAYQMNPDMIVTLDDDCLPSESEPGFLNTHWERLCNGGKTSAWVTTLEGTATRGVPYYHTERQLPCILNHGLWNSVPDFDALTQLHSTRSPIDCRWIDKTIPVGSYFPMCGMNIAFRPAAVPALYFLLMGKDHKYDRLGDIWAGIILKRIADHLGYCLQSGRPAVKHLRASNVWANLRKEAPGLEINETFWREVDRVRLNGDDFRSCYIQIATGLRLEGEYWDMLRRAMHIWADLFAA